MEILCFSGIPGSGKTLDATSEALKHYRSENGLFRRILPILLSKLPGKLGNKGKERLKYIHSFPYNRINNVYSTYPILLDKKHNIYSLQ